MYRVIYEEESLPPFPYIIGQCRFIAAVRACGLGLGLNMFLTCEVQNNIPGLVGWLIGGLDGAVQVRVGPS